MLGKNINLINFKTKEIDKSINTNLKLILKKNHPIIKSLKKSYIDKYNQKIFKAFKKKFDYRIIGMGGSTLGAQAIYDFLKNKIKKNFYFVHNLKLKNEKLNKKPFNNIIISKSGNTVETIVNSNILIKKNDKNLFITENKNSYLKILAKKLKSEVVDHNDYIGGRYSVLSEVGMLPSELMGLDKIKFRQFNNLIKNKKFINSLILNVSATLFFLKKKNLIQ